MHARRDGLGCKIGDSGRVQYLEHGLLRFRPDGVGGAEGLPVAGDSGDEAEIEADRAVDGLDDLAYGGLAAGGEKLEASGMSPAGGDESGAAESLQDLGKKAQGSSRGVSQRGKQRALVGGQRGQVDAHPNRIVSGAGQLHGRTGLSHRMASSKPYVKQS